MHKHFAPITVLLVLVAAASLLGHFKFGFGPITFGFFGGK